MKKYQGHVPRFYIVSDELSGKQDQHVMEQIRRLHKLGGGESILIEVTQDNATEVAHLLERLANVATPVPEPNRWVMHKCSPFM